MKSVYTLDDLQDGPFEALVKCWRVLRPDEDGLPERGDFDPPLLAPLMASVHILEWVDPPHDIRYRLCGTEEIERLGEASLGSNYLDHLDEEAARYCREHLHRINLHPCGTLIRSEEYGIDDKVRLTSYLTLPIVERVSERLQVISQVHTEEEVAVFERSVLNDLDWRDRLISLTPVDIGFGAPSDLPAFVPGVMGAESHAVEPPLGA